MQVAQGPPERAAGGKYLSHLPLSGCACGKGTNRKKAWMTQDVVSYQGQQGGSQGFEILLVRRGFVKDGPGCIHQGAERNFCRADGLTGTTSQAAFDVFPQPFAPGIQRSLSQSQHQVDPSAGGISLGLQLSIGWAMGKAHSAKYTLLGCFEFFCKGWGQVFGVSRRLPVS